MLFRLAWRSLWRHRRRTVLTVFAISMGLALAIFFISLEEGAYDQVIADAVRIEAGHIVVEHPEYLDAPSHELTVRPTVYERLDGWLGPHRDVVVVRPVVLTQGLATTAHGTKGVALYGVDPEREKQARSPLARPENLVAGEYFQRSDEPRALVGAELAEELELDVGRRLNLTASNVAGETQQLRFEIAGIFASGSSEIDGHIVQIPIKTARELLGLRDGETHRVGMILTGIDAIDTVLAESERALTGVDAEVATRTWQEVMPELWAFMQVDAGGTWIMQAIVIGLLLFIIFNTLYMSVMEREREFAVLYALGTPRRRLLKQVIAESMWVGLLSVSIGVALGYGVSEYFRAVGFDFSVLFGEDITISGFFFDPMVYPNARPYTLIALGGGVFLATLVMGLLPARRATNVNIADTLRSAA